MRSTLKPKKCKVCKSEFAPRNSFHAACSIECAATWAAKLREKATAKAQSAERAADRAKRDQLKTKGDLTREAQTAFNTYIRLRDAGQPCICCGRTSTGAATGGDWDAGHYRSRGSAPHLRFDERNVHAQLKQCNRYDSGNVVGYRQGLIARIGRAAVEALEADQAPRHYSREDLIVLKAEYQAKARQLRKTLA